MEKFAIDLDKVLDDFELNEEQSVRSTPFIREELPAKKYQRPPFQRINLADADFSPSLQTASPLIPYRPQQDSNPPKSLIDEDSDYQENFNGLEKAEEVIEVAVGQIIPDLLGNDAIQAVSGLPDLTETGGDRVGPDLVGGSVLEAIVAEPESLMNNTDDSLTSEPEPFDAPRISELETLPTSLTSAENYLCDIESTETPTRTDVAVPSDDIEDPIETLSEEIRDEFTNSLDPDLARNIESVMEKDDDLEREKGSVSSGVEDTPNTFTNDTDYSKEPKVISTEILSVDGDTDATEEIVEPGSVNIEPIDISMNMKTNEAFDNSANEYTEKFMKNDTVMERETEGRGIERVCVVECLEAVKSKKRVKTVESAKESQPIKKFDVEESKEEEKTNEDVREEGVSNSEKPVTFVEDRDMSEDDLERYLEQLENEESLVTEELPTKTETNASSDTAETDTEREAPQRPKSLDLKIEETATPENRPVDTPVPAETSSPDEGKTGDGIIDDDTRTNEEAGNNRLSSDERRLGKVTPWWVPDADAFNCMQCAAKFTVLRRRHHCRACGRVLCSKCCDMRATIEYLNNEEHRVCQLCFRTLTKVMMYEDTDSEEAENSPRRRPNPNNPMEYCSTVPPPLQASPSSSQPPPSVLVPVLKREGTGKVRDPQKKVMFSDGIRPGGDLTALDDPPAPRTQRAHPKRQSTPPGSAMVSPVRILPPIDPATQSFTLQDGLPPVCEISAGSVKYLSPPSDQILRERLRDPSSPPTVFAVNRHLVVSLKIVKKDCCMGQTCWVFSTRGMNTVGQDELVVILQMTSEDEAVPTEVFMQLHCIYQEADKGNSVGELGYWSVKQPVFLDSRQHGGFLFVRPTFQCVQKLDKPPAPFLVAVLIHRLELPWARQFPLRLLLRLGAEFRYYPCSLVSVRHRDSVYFEIGTTIIKLLADFCNYTFTLPTVRGLRIHMEAQKTSILIPRNRYDQLVRALNNDPYLALAGSFSREADAHLVCMQSKGDEVSYSTQAINIHDKPRRVTGASFVVFNGSLKAASSNVQGSSHIIEDGLMVSVSMDTMALLRSKLRACEDWSLSCGAEGHELIQVQWCGDDKDYNRGVVSGIDSTPLDGVPSIRVHRAKDFMCTTRFIRWTEVFIIKNEDGVTPAKNGDHVEVKKLAEGLAKATCVALTKARLLDDLASSGVSTLSLRATIAPELVCYEAGSNGQKLGQNYMNKLDNELIPVLHKATAGGEVTTVLELVFHILDQ